MNEASVNLLKQNNGMKEIFSNNFFLSTFQSYHPLREIIPRLQPRWHRALTEARSHSHTDTVPWGATVAKANEVATINTRRRRPQRSHRSRKHMQ